MAGWLGKGRGTVARLAAVLALLDWTANRPSNAPPPTTITTQHLCAAWDLWERYYRPHAQAVFDRAGPRTATVRGSTRRGSMHGGWSAGSARAASRRSRARRCGARRSASA